MGHARLEETLDRVGGVLMLLTAVATLETCGTRGHYDGDHGQCDHQCDSVT